MPSHPGARWSLRDAFGRTVLLTTWTLAAREEREAALSPALARQALARVLRQARFDGSRQDLAAICAALGYDSFNLQAVGTAQLAQRIIDAAERGRLLVLDEAQGKAAGDADSGDFGGGTAMDSEPAPPPSNPAPAPRPKQELSWIEVQVTDEAGQPYAGRVRVTLANGTAIDASTDSDGLLRLDGIVPGSCTVVLPELSERLRA